MDEGGVQEFASSRGISQPTFVASCLQSSLPKGHDPSLDPGAGTSARSLANAVMVRVCMNLREIYRGENAGGRQTASACAALAHTCRAMDKLQGHPGQEVVNRRLLQWALGRLGVLEEARKVFST